MTKEEILKIKEHIEIHARRERGAVMITELLWKAVYELEHITDIEKENEQLKEKNKILEAKNFEKCPFRYSDMGCDYCDWKDRDLKEEYEKELQEEMQQHEQRMFDLQCQNYDFDYGDMKY